MEFSSIQPPLRFTEGTGHIWGELKKIPRTGWMKWEIPDPENVAEHILAIRSLAVSWRESIELSDEDFSDLLAMIEVHDWPEVETGDMVVMGNEVNVTELRQAKKEKERLAMEDICHELPQREEILSLYYRYEKGMDDVARYAKQLDKLQAVLLSEQYDKKFGKPGMVAEFVRYSEQFVDIPFLVEQLAAISARLKF